MMPSMPVKGKPVSKEERQARIAKEILAGLHNDRTEEEQEQRILRALDAGSSKEGWGEEFNKEWLDKIVSRKTLGKPSKEFVKQILEKTHSIIMTLSLAGAAAEDFIEPLYDCLKTDPRYRDKKDPQKDNAIESMLRAAQLNTFGEDPLFKKVLLGLRRAIGVPTPQNLSDRKMIFGSAFHFGVRNGMIAQMVDQMCAEDPALIEERERLKKLQKERERLLREQEKLKKVGEENRQGLRDFKNNPFAEKLKGFKPK